MGVSVVRRRLLSILYLILLLALHGMSALAVDGASISNDMETATVEICKRWDRHLTDRVYVSNETMQSMVEARTWPIRELPDVWRDYKRTSNILYGDFAEMHWPTTEPDRYIPDRYATDGSDDVISYWTMPAAHYANFDHIRVYYENEAGHLFYVALKPMQIAPGQKDNMTHMLDNGILAFSSDDWIHLYALDAYNTFDLGDGKEMSLTYKMGCSFGLTIWEMLEFLWDL